MLTKARHHLVSGTNQGLMALLRRLQAKLERVYACSNSSAFTRYLRKKGVRVGNNVRFYEIKNITIDLTRPSLITIGDDVRITAGVKLLTHGADWHVLLNIYDDLLASSGPVTIEDNVFLGTNCIILKGVTIGRDSIVGAGSVVTRSTPPRSVIAGNPAKVLFDIDTYYAKRKACYVQEAQLYARSIQERFARTPIPEDFWEEFPLFGLDTNANIEEIARYQLGGHYESYRSLYKPRFGNFDVFLEEAGLSADSVAKNGPNEI